MSVRLTYKVSNTKEIFERYFETKDKAWKWVRNQDGHPWLSISVIELMELNNVD